MKLFLQKHNCLPVTAVAIASLSLALTAITPAIAQDLTPVSIQFSAEMAGQPLNCQDTYEGVGTTAAAVTVSDFKLYVSQVHLLDESGTETPVTLNNDGIWSQERVALLDFEDGRGHCQNGTLETNATLQGTAPAGDYSGVAFEIGVPFDINHVDPTLTASPMNLTSMFWNWRGGYRFMRLDIAVAPNNESMMAKPMKEGMHKDQGHGEAKHGKSKHGGHHGHGDGRGWALHVGSAACQASMATAVPEVCDAPNRIRVVLPDFDPATQTIIVDPARVLSQSDVTQNTPDTAPGCMSSPGDPECDVVFPLLGLSADAGIQQLISVR